MNFFKSILSRGSQMEIKKSTPENTPADAPAGENTIDDTASETPDLRETVVSVLHTVYDPEIPVDIYELGLIYSIDITPAREVEIKMTLTAPNCPAAGILPSEVEAKVRAIPGVSDVRLELVWEPAWNKDMMSEAARLTLGFF